MQAKSFVFSTVLLVSVISFTANAANWYPFPDTGQTNCYDVGGNVIDCPAEGEALHGQDAQYTDAAQSFQDNGDNTITDLNTILMWQNTDDGIFSWADAMHYCVVLSLAGYGDWRLPEIVELQSIADYSGVNPASNPVFSYQFSHEYTSYWSATTYTSTSSFAWAIDFYNGRVSTRVKDNTYNVRCVRAGRPSESFDLTVILPGSGSGAIHFTPPDEKCITSCSKNYITGTEVTLTAAAGTGSGFSGWSGGGCSGTGNCLVSMDWAKDVTATFTLGSYTLTYTAGANGSIDGSSPQTVDHGSDGSSVLAVPDEGYAFVQWSDGSTDNPHTDTNVTADINATAIFEIINYTLTYTAGANGSIDGSSPQTVEHGSAGSSVEAVPDTGYEFDMWSDGSTDNPRTDTNVTADLGVTASFVILNYSLTYNAGECGILNGDSPQTVSYGGNGSSVEIEVDIESCYHYIFVQWSDGSTDNPRIDTDVTADINVTASFGLDSHTLTYTAGANGSFSENSTSPQTVEHGSAGSSVEAVADTGYEFVMWSDESTDNPRTDTNVTADISVTANFQPILYTLSYTASNGGTLTGEDTNMQSVTQSVPYYGDGTPVIAVPDEGYEFVQWSDHDPPDNPHINNPRTDTSVTEDITVEAEFQFVLQ